MSKRKQHAPESKPKVALESLKGEANHIRAGGPVRCASEDDQPMEACAAEWRVQCL